MTSPELVALAKKNPIAVACIALSVALGVAIYFRSDSIPAANAELDQKSADARRYALNVSNATQLKEQLEALAAANKAMETRFIRASEIGINQQYFYKMESDSGVKLLELNQTGRRAANQPKDKLAPVSFYLSVQGTFAQVLNFARAAESGTHYTRIVSASCSGSRKGLVTLSLTIELLGRQ